MIAIIDYGMGNLRSLENALGRLGAEFEVTSDPSVILSANRVVLSRSSIVAIMRHRIASISVGRLIPSLGSVAIRKTLR